MPLTCPKGERSKGVANNTLIYFSKSVYGKIAAVNSWLKKTAKQSWIMFCIIMIIIKKSSFYSPLDKSFNYLLNDSGDTSNISRSSWQMQLTWVKVLYSNSISSEYCSLILTNMQVNRSHKWVRLISAMVITHKVPDLKQKF